MGEEVSSDPSHVLDLGPMDLQPDLSYEEKPVAILDTKERVLRRRTVRLVKVLWTHHDPQEATWEIEDDVRQKYPHLFMPGEEGEDNHRMSYSRPHIAKATIAYQRKYGTYSNVSFPVYVEDIDAGDDASPSSSMLSEVASRLKITIVGGSIPERSGDHLYNTCSVFGTDGRLKAKHRKITFKESKTLTAGETPTIANTEAVFFDSSGVQS